MCIYIYLYLRKQYLLFGVPRWYHFIYLDYNLYTCLDMFVPLYTMYTHVSIYDLVRCHRHNSEARDVARAAEHLLNEGMNGWIDGWMDG